MTAALKRIALVILIITKTTTPGQASSAGLTNAVKLLTDVKPQLQDGDLIFTRIAICANLAETTHSWETHVGIIFNNKNDGWQVYESAVPLSRISSLDKFVARSQEQRFAIRRAKISLTSDEKTKLRQSASSRVGKLYHLGFKYDSARLYCSKLVYDSYLEATDRKVGRIETFREVLAANPEAPVWFWRLWFFGFIPWERRCVTTTSELKDKNFVTVFDTETSKLKKTKAAP